MKIQSAKKKKKGSNSSRPWCKFGEPQKSCISCFRHTGLIEEDKKGVEPVEDDLDDDDEEDFETRAEFDDNADERGLSGLMDTDL